MCIRDRAGHDVLKHLALGHIAAILLRQIHGVTAGLTARDVNAAAIVTVSESGTTARLVSKYRPQQPIIACVMREQVQRQLSLSLSLIHI